ncbi:glycosyltransferase [Limosilactobacillus secaliphilus]|uniref:Glycosyltransferase n=1 Tax=Limosilactobacillus secaliphilus TaxID=396268 RepID=A0A0R2I227_9LACO|nr:glycosyltransferase [Limosilactobacillus secaliphilus]KRN58939.1 glycosyltransferase [Limosilactobacillus secaliphilus]
MYYFITHREDLLTSAIEIAQIKRMKIFDSLGMDSRIVTVKYNWAHQDVQQKLGTANRVINLFQYYQRLPYSYTDNDQALSDKILHQPGLDVKGNVAYRDGKQRIQVNLNDKGRIYYVDYTDRFGFCDRRDFYDSGCLTYSEYFEDKARVVMRQYYDAQGHVKIIYHYRGGENNQPVLTLIQLKEKDGERQFDDETEFHAFFFDELAKNDAKAVMISDRSDVALTPFAKMKVKVPRYQVFHSAITTDGRTNGKLFDVYKPIQSMLANGQLNGLISATTREARDASQRFKTNASYAIPVTYVADELLNKQVPFDERQPGQLIAVARLSNVKRLDHLINTVILLKKKHPLVDLKIYGYDDEYNNYATSNALKKLVQRNDASDYIHFCGYQHDLTAVYEDAQIEVLTSSYEGFAMALLEAQSHACPVVSYDINYGPSDIIDDGVSGKLVPEGDLHSLYVTLDTLLSNYALLQSYSEHAQKAAAKYSFANVTKRWQEFLAAEHLPH